MSSENWAEDCGELANRKIMPTAFGGHCFYVRKCITGDQSGTFWERKIGEIEIPDTVANRSNTVEVLAIGPRVAKPCTKAHCRKYERMTRLPDQVKVGDMLLCPSTTDIRFLRSPLGNEEFFIEESIPLAILT